MRNRNLIIAAIVVIVLAAAAFGYSLTRGTEEPPSKVETAKVKERLRDACASPETYARLKEVAFEEAVRIRNADPENLDRLATHSVVRMEDPVVKSRDAELNVTVCSGRFILELPPGAERGFGGERRLVADIEYAAQEAVDGSGLVYEIRGAEPIIYKLAAFDLRGGTAPTPAPVREETFAEAEVEEAPAPPSEPLPQFDEPEEPQPVQPAPQPAVQRERPAPSASARPSFNCRYARTRSERMICSSDRLAAKDRAMSSLFYSALSDADSRARRELRRTRDGFLRYRDRCGSEACVAQAYDDRMDEIRDIMAASQ